MRIAVFVGLGLLAGSVAVGGPLGAVAASAACGRTTPWPARASPAAAPMPTTPVRKMRRETRGCPGSRSCSFGSSMCRNGRKRR